MNLKSSAIIGALVLLTAYKRKDEASTEAADVWPANERLDAAVQEMTVAYFYHVPRAATQA